jgi:hypothetical protein
MIRIVLGILTGFIVTAALSTGVDHIFHSTGVYPPYGEPFFDTSLLLLATTYRFLFQILGAYLACLVAKEKAKIVVWTIGILGTALWLMGGLMNQDLGPLWYSVLGAALSIPSVLLGKRIFER